VGTRFSAPVHTGPGAHPASCSMGTGSFPGVESGQCVTLTPHPLLVLGSRKGRVIPLLPLWAIRPVRSLSACTRVHFTIFFWYMAPYTWLIGTCGFETTLLSHRARVEKPIEEFFIGFYNTVKGITFKYSP